MKNFDELEAYEERIQQYILDQLNATEKAAFEALLLENEALAEEVRFRQKIRFVKTNQEQIKTDLILQDIIANTPLENDNSQEEPPQNDGSGGTGSSKLLISSVVIGLVALLASLYFFNQANEPTNYTALANQYAKPYENIISNDPSQVNLLGEGMKAYEAGNYTEAISYLESAASRDEVPRFYLALSYLMNKQNTQAIDLLQSIDQLDDPVLDAPSRWYLALAYLQIKENEQAKTLLNSIKEGEEFYEDAKSLLKQLE